MLTVIGAGFGRTGTLSQKAALEQLGFGPCYHMVELIGNPERIDQWAQPTAGGTFDWDQIFAGYASTVDWPAAAYWRPLAQAYPDAKVLLSVRDPQKWYDSVNSTIYYAYKLIQNPDQMPPAMRERMGDAPGPRVKLLQELVWEGAFDGRFEDREYAISVFEKHNQEVRDTIPANRLLVYQVSQGWGPLCEFLGVPVPDGDFPQVNEGADFRTKVLQGEVPNANH
jgi:hypothetical protein